MEKGIVAVVGPTGVGKSDIALEVARRIPAEIVCVDSMQVYRGLEVGTGKPSRKARAEIPHHGLDLVEPAEPFDVVRYVKAVTPVIRAIQGRGRIPLLVGGSGLYFRILERGWADAPGEDTAFRAHLREEARVIGSPRLHGRLKRVDPVSADRIHPNDLKRIVRALEIFYLTGRALSGWHRQGLMTAHAGWNGQVRWVGLTADRERLYPKIEARIDRWLREGWIEECRRLLSGPLSLTAREALGYKELFAYLEGRGTLPETIGLIKRNSRRYAKRQWTWFRANPRITWICVDRKGPQEVAQEVVSCGASKPAGSTPLSDGA